MKLPRTPLLAAATALAGAGAIVAIAAGGSDEPSAAAATSAATSIGTVGPAAPTRPDAGTTGPSAAAASRRASSARRTGTIVRVRSTRYGRILVGPRGRALYLFTRDRTARSRCYGACAEAWPPLYTKGTPRGREGAKESQLGTTRRSGGRRQVTYRGQPLYYFVGDRAPGQVTCQAVDEFGGTWLVVGPDGHAIR